MIKPLVLLVEDDLAVAVELTDILTQNGYEVIANIVTTEQAIASIEYFNPAIVLIEINLKQDKEGVNLGEYLSKMKKIPYVYLASCVDKTILERIVLTRPHGYVSKPFRELDLLATISIAIHNFNHKCISEAIIEEKINDDIPFILRQCIVYIQENINEKIKIVDLARQTRWESQHFNRLFAKYIGVTPHKYIIEKKIEKAKLLLTETLIPITQISYELGFKSHSNFCSIFRKATHKTPENYRKWNGTSKKYIE